MPEKARVRAEADRLRSTLEQRGAEVVEFDILQPAETLLDLYGEDIRGRAFVTQDPSLGEMMLRPDFTVPLVSRLVIEGRRSGRFTYAGEVFRRQEDQPDRASEYLQVGFEVAGGTPAEADAEVFSTIASLLAPLNLTATMGDIGLLKDAVAGLKTSDARKAALLHHLWRPGRFRRLLDRFADAGSADAPLPPASDAVAIGLRSKAEVQARIEALRDDKTTQPISAEEVAMIDAVTGMSGDAPAAVDALRKLAAGFTAIAAGVARLEARLDAMSGLGVNVEKLHFDASYGRTSMEYYDGMVFGFHAADRPDLPPVATGGRYDALTAALGDAIPAVGGVIRPGVAVEVRGDA